MQISPRDQLLLTVVGLIVVLAAIIGFLIVPQVGTLTALDAEIDKARRDVEVQQTLLRQREAMKDEAAQTDAKALKLGALVPDRPDLPSLIIELQDIAFAAGVKLTAVTPGAPTDSESGTYTVIPLDMTVEGTWTDVVDFLQRLPKLTRGIRTVEFAANVIESEELSLYSSQGFVKVEAYSVPSSPTADPAAPETVEPAPAQ